MDPVVEPRSLLLAITVFLGNLLVIFSPPKDRSLPLTGSALAFFVPLTALLFLSAALSVGSLIPAESIVGTARLFLFGNLAVIVLVRSRQYPKFRDHLILGFSLTSLIVASIGLLEILAPGLILLPGGVEPHSVMANRNLLASYLLFTAPFSVMLIRTSRKGLVLGTSALVVISFLIGYIKSRSVLLALTCGALWMLFALGMTKRLRRPNRQVATVAALIAISLIAGLLQPSRSLSYDLQSSDPSGVQAGFLSSRIDDSAKMRLGLWSATIKMIRSHPLRGCGLGQWKIRVHEFFREPSGNNSRPVYAHNDFLQVIAETGVVAGGLFLLLLSVLWALAARTLLRSGHSLGPAVSSIVFFFATDAFFGFPFHRMAHPIVLFGSAGMFLGSLPAADKRRAVTGWKYTVVIVILVAFSSSSVILFGHRYQKDVAANSLRTSAFRSQCAEVTKRLSDGESYWYATDISGVPIAHFKGGCALSTGKIAQADSLLSHARKLNPFFSGTLNNLALVHLKKGEPLRALAMLDSVLLFSPGHLDATVNKAVILGQLGEIQSAIDHLESLEGERPTEVNELLSLLKASVNE